MRYSCPALGGKPEATYSSSSGDNWRLAPTQRHWARNPISISPAKICGRPTLNSLMAWNMNFHLYHAALSQRRFGAATLCREFFRESVSVFPFQLRTAALVLQHVRNGG